jgi:two-component system, cell cycle response regulator
VIAIIAIPESATSRDLTDVLSDAGWTVRIADDPEQALRLCRRTEVDVLLVHDEIPGGPLAFMDRLKGDSELFSIAVVFVGDGLGVADVVSAMNRGAADVLRTPVDPADAIARATAAARTKALVKELTQHNDRLEGLVLFDELTGLRNRRAIMHDLEMLLATARRHGRALSAVMVDIDRFKAINDEHGHRAGDDVLREVARRLSARLRDADVAGRIGGDELLVLLPETTADGAATLAQSIRGAVSERPVDTSEGLIAVTVSLGSAAWEGEAGEALIDRADRALYAAKGAGRDRAIAL